MKPISLCFALLLLAGLPARAQAPKPSKVAKLAAKLCQENPKWTAEQCRETAFRCQQFMPRSTSKDCRDWIYRLTAGPSGPSLFPELPVRETAVADIGSHPRDDGGRDRRFELIAWTLILIGMYFLPAIVAWRRHHHQKDAIQLLNLLLGWTVIGWIVALVWAATATPGHPAPDKNN